MVKLTLKVGWRLLDHGSGANRKDWLQFVQIHFLRIKCSILFVVQFNRHASFRSQP